MIRHLGIFASDFAASKRSYSAALAPLGVVIGYESETIAEFWRTADDVPSLSLETATNVASVTRGLHLAFTAGSEAEVDQFHRQALAAGGMERHPPRYWPEYRAYCAFVSDPDGNNIEAVIKAGDPASQ